jgi:hypothetical protein
LAMQHSPAEMVCSLHGIQAGAGEPGRCPDHDVFDRSLRALTPAAKNTSSSDRHPHGYASHATLPSIRLLVARAGLHRPGNRSEIRASNN